MSITTVMLMVLVAFAAVPTVAEGKERVIVLFKEDVDEKLVKDHGGKVERTLSIIPAIITSLEEKEIKELAKNPKIYDLLIGSLAPSLYGLKEIKESIIMQLFGGVPKRLKDKTNIRGDIHVLLIGDPASGKSQLLKLVPEIVPRGKYVSGKGTTGAGLTATVTKDEQFMGGWVLEAGALVLANRGMLAVDEFEKMSQEDQVAMHEGLEQGTVSIAKASIVATLPAKTAVLAGGNPKFSRFDPFVPISKQITITDTLLSRFDLKFALRDVPEAGFDKKVVDHVNLVANLRASQNRHKGPLRGGNRLPQITDLFLHQKTSHARQVCCHARGGSVGAVSRTKSIIDEDIRQRSQLARHFWVIFLFPGVEAGVLQHQDLPRFQLIGSFFSF